MKLRMLVVITLLALGCSFASAQTYTFGFADANGDLYCDYEQLVVSSGTAAGIDNLSGCGMSINATLIGGAAKDPQLAQNFPVIVGAILADNILDLDAGSFTDSQAVLFQALKCNKPDKNGKYHGKYGWLIVVAEEGIIYGDNYGYLSCTIPTKGDGDALMRGTSMGKLREKLRK
jgi:hypothetical protein